MLTLIFIVILGVGIALFAMQNTLPTSLTFWQYSINNIPVYIVALAPFIVGLLIAWFINLIKDLSQRLTISEQKDRIKKKEKEIAELTKEIHKLEIEDTKLKAEKGEDIDEDSI